MKPLVEHKPLSATKVLKRAEIHLRTINIQDNLQHQKMDLSVRRLYLKHTFHSVAVLLVSEV
jgi:hypothetical protein